MVVDLAIVTMLTFGAIGSLKFMQRGQRVYGEPKKQIRPISKASKKNG